MDGQNVVRYQGGRGNGDGLATAASHTITGENAMSSTMPQPLSISQPCPFLPMQVSRLAMTRKILDVPHLYQALHRRKTIESKCLRFIILTVCRPGEVVKLPPAEIKIGRAHV